MKKLIETAEFMRKASHFLLENSGTEQQPPNPDTFSNMENLLEIYRKLADLVKKNILQEMASFSEEPKKVEKIIHDLIDQMNVPASGGHPVILHDYDTEYKPEKEKKLSDLFISHPTAGKIFINAVRGIEAIGQLMTHAHLNIRGSIVLGENSAEKTRSYAASSVVAWRNCADAIEDYRIEKIIGPKRKLQFSFHSQEPTCRGSSRLGRHLKLLPRRDIGCP